MSSVRCERLNVPLRLYLDFDETTVGEFRNILRNWRALLRPEGQ